MLEKTKDMLENRKYYVYEWLRTDASPYYVGKGTGILRNKTDGGEGYKKSEATRRKLSMAAKGKTPWNKGLTAKTSKSVAKYTKTKTGVRTTWYKGPVSEEAKKRMSEGQKGKVYPTRPCEICGIQMKVNAMASHLRIHQKRKD